MPSALRSDLLPLEPTSWPGRLRSLPGATPRSLAAGRLIPARPEGGRTVPSLVWRGPPATSREPGGDPRLRRADRPLIAVLRGALLSRWTTDHGRSAIGDVAGPGDLLWPPSPGRLGGDRPPAAGMVEPLPPVALSASEVVVVPPWSLQDAIARDRDLAWRITDALAARSERLERALARSLTLRLPERLLVVLTDLAGAHGRAVSEGTLIDLPLTQDLLAQMAGGTRESVNRALRSLARSRRVAALGRKIVLREREPVSDDGR